jgi:hypothetical protein
VRRPSHRWFSPSAALASALGAVTIGGNTLTSAAPSDLTSMYTDLAPVHADLAPVHSDLAPVHTALVAMHTDSAAVHTDFAPVSLITLFGGT